MGASTSNFTPQQTADIAKALKETYAYCQNEGFSDKMTLEKMSDTYNSITWTYLSKIIPTEAGRPFDDDDASIMSDPTNGGGLPSFMRPTTASARRHFFAKNAGIPVKESSTARRRSYDWTLRNKSRLMKEAAEAAAAAAALAALNEDQDEDVPERVDTWDSVSQQPFCAICQMAFKSPVFLERHCKFSDLHLRNVERKEKGFALDGSDPLAPSNNSPSPEEPKERLTSQVEGTHYKLIYSGAKLFWRTKKSVDLSIYLHVLPQVIEVIAFDPDRHKELNRIYLNYARMMEIVFESSLCEEATQVELEKIKEGRLATPPEIEVIRHQQAKNLFLTFIIARLHLNDMGMDGIRTFDFKDSDFIFSRLPGDTYDYPSPETHTLPTNLVPISIARRRRSNAEEIDAAISGVEMHKRALVEAVATADSMYYLHSVKMSSVPRTKKLAKIVEETANSMAEKKWWTAVSTPKRRFIKAVRLVIRRKRVHCTQEVLNDLQKKDSFVLNSIRMNHAAIGMAREI